MSGGSIVVSRPAQPSALVLVFHGVGSSAANMAPVGEVIARQRPDAWVVIVEAPYPASSGAGRQWFSVAGVTEANRPARIEAVMPEFLQCIAEWQQASGVDAAGTMLVGFSQGAIMSLEATQREGVASPAARIVAMAGRFAMPVRQVPQDTRIHLVHGDADPVMPVVFAREAHGALTQKGASATLDVVPGLGHGIDARAVAFLSGYVA